MCALISVCVSAVRGELNDVFVFSVAVQVLSVSGLSLSPFWSHFHSTTTIDRRAAPPPHLPCGTDKDQSRVPPNIHTTKNETHRYKEPGKTAEKLGN